MDNINQYYKSSSRYTKVNSFRLNAILEQLADCSSQSLVFDLGCGEGIIGKAIKDKYNCQVYGFDVSDKSVEIAKTVLDRAHVSDLNDFKFPNDSASPQYIVISEVLEHLFEPEKLLISLRKQIDIKTKIIISVPNVLFWKNRLKILLGSFEYTDGGLMDRGHIHFFSWQSFVKMIESCGYKIVKIKNHQPTRWLKPIAKFIPGFSSFQFIITIKIN